MLDHGDIGLWAVADGMGGHSAGDLASQLIVNTLSKVEPQEQLATFVDEVEERVLQVNNRLFEVANSHNQTSGSTLVALITHGEHAITLWAGDSRLYRLRDSELTQLTTDHTQIELYIEKGLVTREEAVGHPSGNMVTRAVGVTDNLLIEMDIFELEDGDRFLLCSDGLDKHVQDPEIEEIMKGADPQSITDKLIETTLSRGATDNVTVCVVEVSDDGFE